MLFTSSRSRSRIRKPCSTIIRLETLEARLPPGDILFGLAVGSVWLRPENLLGNQGTVVMQESAVAGSNDLSVLPALDETLPLRPRHVARLTDARSASSHFSPGVPPLAMAGFDLPDVQARGQLLLANEEGTLPTRWQGPAIGMPWSNHETAGGALLVVDLPVVQAGASIPGNEVNEQLPLAFDRAGVLHIRADEADQTISETVTPAGFVEVTVAGQRHSADPGSDSFDASLTGATSGALAGLWLESGGAREMLILGSQQLAGGLLVHAGDAQVVTQDVSLAGPLAIQGSTITVRGSLHGSAITLAASGLISVEAPARVTADQVAVAADIFVNAGQMHVDGAIGGRIDIQARNILNAGPITADGLSGDGGQMGIAFTGSYVGTVAGLTSANGGQGGSVRIDGGSTGRLYSSGSHLATGTRGGQVDLLGREVVLPGATVDASGQNAGGTIRIGGDSRGRNPNIVNAQTVTVTGATTIRANATDSGSGGRVAIWSDGETEFAGSVAAHGGAAGGDGGFVEVSGKGNMIYAGSADAGARLGRTGALLLDPKNIVISEAPVGVFPQFDLIDPHPTAGGEFGRDVLPLNTGNITVTNPNDNFGGTGAGAAYLFDGLSGALLSSLVGSHPNDGVGVFGVTPLSNGNYVIRSPYWNGQRGAITWGDGRTGIHGVLSEANSLIGSNPGDLNISSITTLSNGNYLVRSPYLNDQRGAVTWGNGMTGVQGTVSIANSLVGSSPNDMVGSDVTPLSNGNYAVRSWNWNGRRGAVTWGDGRTAIHGTVSDTISLVGSNPGDYVGGDFIVPLSNGNYLLPTASWNGGRGAVTWVDGSTGLRGIVSGANSLVGSNPGDYVGHDQLGGSGITLLSNGNYLVRSTVWNDQRGAVTWGNGISGVRGTVSEANSLVGSNPGDRVGGGEYFGGVTPLNNGNYLIRSPFWNALHGAVTWGDGTGGVTGTISDANSLVGSNPNDFVGSAGVFTLSNRNYVVGSPNWNGARGAVTWANGETGSRGLVSDANSLVGTNLNDHVGMFVSPLSNGNYVASSPDWSNARGAVTWGDGGMGMRGTVSDANSLVGSNPGDRVGCSGFIATCQTSGVRPLSNGNYVASSPYWSDARGAVTWGDGSSMGVRGAVSEANSLVGSNTNDLVGTSTISLDNGNYLVNSSAWNGLRGAVTWGDGSAGIRGVVSEANSLVGGSPFEQVGNFGIVLLTNGNYVIRSLYWNGQRGAVTWGNGRAGVRGVLSDANSLVGSNQYDLVGRIITPLNNGNFVVGSPGWNSQRGAATWEDGTTGVRGTISDANSIVGSNPTDSVGSGITLLSNGNYLLLSPSWNGYRGAVTWAVGTTGRTLDGRGVITPQNSLIGPAINAGFEVVVDLIHQSFLASFVSQTAERVEVGLSDPNQFSYTRGQAQTVTLTPEFLTSTLNTGTAVVLQASNDITINSPITVSASGQGGALTLQAGRSIVLNAGINTDNGNLTLIANDRRTNGVVDSQRDPGNAFITMALGTSLTTGTGALTVELRDGAGLTHRDSGAISLTDITAGSASITNNGPSAGSDIRVGAVTTSGSQSYTDPNGVTQVFGNLTAQDNPITFNDSTVVNSGVSVDAGAEFVTFAGSGVQLLTAGSGARFGNVDHTGTGSLRLNTALTVTGQLTNTAGTFDANDYAVTVSRLTSITGGTYLAGTAPQTFAGGLLVAGGIFTSSSGPMTVAGLVAVTSGFLSGEGMLDSVTALGGIVAPGPANRPGVLTVNGAVSLFSSTAMSFRLDGPTPGSEYSQLVASGSVFLSNSTLTLVVGFEPKVGTSFEILTSQAGPISGTFDGLDEGAIFSQGGYQFQITYQGGANGTSVVVVRVG